MSQASINTDGGAADSSTDPDVPHTTISIHTFIDDVASTVGVESQPKTVKGLDWKVLLVQSMNEEGESRLRATLHGWENPSKLWTAEVQGRFVIYNNADGDDFIHEFAGILNSGEGYSENIIGWDALIDPENGYNYNEFIYVDTIFNIKNVSGLRKRKAVDYSSPSHLTDAILVIGKEKVHVSKTFLAMHSTVFDRMFFGKFSESNEEEIELKEIDHKVFCKLLDVIYPSKKRRLLVGSIEQILALADRFEVEAAISECENFLINTNEMETAQLLVISDKFNLCKLQNACLSEIKDSETVREIARSEHYSSMSDKLKVTLWERQLDEE